MAFMGKDWVTLAEWLRYERRVLRRAWQEVNLVAFLCTGIFGALVTYWLQYEEGFRPARDSVRIFGTAALGALAANLAYLWFLALTAPAKMDLEAEARRRQLETGLDALKREMVEDRKQTRRRGDAPFLIPVDKDFIRLYIRLDAGRVNMVSEFYSGLLCGTRQDVGDLKDGEPVFLPIVNLGKSRLVSLTLDGAPIRLGREADINGAHGYDYLTYNYQKAKHGQEQELLLSFEMSDGWQDTHTYQLVHGKLDLRRVDPPLPL